ANPIDHATVTLTLARPEKRSRRRLALWAAAALVVCLVAGANWLWISRRNRTDLPKPLSPAMPAIGGPGLPPPPTPGPLFIPPPPGDLRPHPEFPPPVAPPSPPAAPKPVPNAIKKAAAPPPTVRKTEEPQLYRGPKEGKIICAGGLEAEQ